jgi:hypothetical protein
VPNEKFDDTKMALKLLVQQFKASSITMVSYSNTERTTIDSTASVSQFQKAVDGKSKKNDKIMTIRRNDKSLSK